MKKRSGAGVMLGLIGMIKPLLGYMFLAILMGTIGHLCATFITVLGGSAMALMIGEKTRLTLPAILGIMMVLAVFRGILRYAEQASNHYIAFKLLARIRHKVFAACRRLAPAKLDGAQKGNLISIITSDIELLEVFYAHTISPIAIAILTSIVMSLFLGQYHWVLGVIAAICYVIVGAVIPIINGRFGQEGGRDYRSRYGKLNTTVLDNLYGLDEILQYHQQEKRLHKMDEDTDHLEQINEKLKDYEAWQRIGTDSAILAAGILMTVCCGTLISKGLLGNGDAIICIIAIMSSFGPTAALSALSNNLNQTLASGNRVLNLLEEEPVVEDIVDGLQVHCGDIKLDQVDFAYQETDGKKRKVLENFTLQFKENTIHGILGESGCGKSTVLKLLMRFYETDRGSVLYQGTNVNEIATSSLRNHIAYVTQETFLFEDTIENNIKVAKLDATREEVIEACKKASIHEFISSLPHGYETRLAELGESISGGQRQRIGIARAFLHDGNVILLDEPTSNIDSLNESIILKSLLEVKRKKTILLVSHRKSTMAIADEITAM